MSKFQSVSFECPKCGADCDGVAYSSVNTALDPQLRLEIFADRINSVVCGRCGAETMIGCNLMYHDMNRRFALWFRPFGEDDGKYARSVSFMRHLPGASYIADAPSFSEWSQFKSAILQMEKTHPKVSNTNVASRQRANAQNQRSAGCLIPLLICVGYLLQSVVNSQL